MGCVASSTGSAVALRPQAPDANTKRTARHRTGASEVARQQEIVRLVADGRARDAARVMQDVVCSDPSNGRLHTQLGQLMKQAGMNGFLAEFKLGATTPHDHPVSAAERETDRASRAISCVEYAVQLAEGHDDLTEAFSTLHEAHRLDPTNAEAYVQRARLVWELDGQTNTDSTGEREVALRKAIKSIGENSVVAAAHSQLANIFLHKQRRVRTSPTVRCCRCCCHRHGCHGHLCRCRPCPCPCPCCCCCVKG
jgi:Flp pilus assembly protein TadD